MLDNKKKIINITYNALTTIDHLLKKIKVLEKNNINSTEIKVINTIIYNKKIETCKEIENFMSEKNIIDPTTNTYIFIYRLYYKIFKNEIKSKHIVIKNFDAYIQYELTQIFKYHESYTYLCVKSILDNIDKLEFKEITIIANIEMYDQKIDKEFIKHLYNVNIFKEIYNKKNKSVIAYNTTRKIIEFYNMYNLVLRDKLIIKLL